MLNTEQKAYINIPEVFIKLVWIWTIVVPGRYLLIIVYFLQVYFLIWVYVFMHIHHVYWGRNIWKLL